MGKRINKTVFVGVSGGVDSSVSAAILKEATPKNYQKLFGRPTPKGFRGYNVVGVFIRTWTPDFIECTWRDERRDAMRVCAHLGIPFLECNAEKEYKKGVADYMIEEYKKGRTPNPDVMCNREVKFGVFWKFAKEHGADYIATGHYAINDLLRTDSSSRSSLTPFCLRQNGTPPPVASQGLSVLRKSPDQSKDQSYFLWTLTQEDLDHTLFPIGHLKKTEVRKLALKYKLPTATKKDSQGVCFLGPLDMKDFLRHYIKEKRGHVLNEKKEIIGYHNGAVFFTLGERHGFTITEKSEKDKPYYVVAKDIKKNTITVGTSLSARQGLAEKRDTPTPTLPLGKGEGKGGGVSIFHTNWIINPPIQNKNYHAQIRYHGELISCQITCTSRTGAEVVFEKNVLVDSGQSIVIYDGDVCLGGGIVESR